MLPHLADWTACVRWRLQSFRRKREWAAGAPSTVATPSLAWHITRGAVLIQLPVGYSHLLVPESQRGLTLSWPVCKQRSHKKVRGRPSHHSERCYECIPHGSATGLIDGLGSSKMSCAILCATATPRVQTRSTSSIMVAWTNYIGKCIAVFQ